MAEGTLVTEVDLPAEKANEATGEEISAAVGYNKMFNIDKSLRDLEQQKKSNDLQVASQAERTQTQILSVAEKAAEQQMDYDSKTELLNSRGLDKRLSESVGQLRRDVDQGKAGSWLVMFADINWFKKFNDVLGQSAGDEYIISMAKIWRGSVRTTGGDLAARHGGEEFMIVLRLNQGVTADEVLYGGEADDGVLGRIGAGVAQLRQIWAEKNPNKFVEGLNGDVGLKEMGVGTLSVGIEHLGAEEIIRRYDDWQRAADSGETESGFLNFALVPAVQTVMKTEAKPLSRNNEVPVVERFVAKNGLEKNI